MKVGEILKSNLSKYIISIFCGLFGIFIVIVASNYSGEITPDNIKTTQGNFIKYYEKEIMGSKSIEIIRYICLDDGKEYQIDSITHWAFNKEKFLREVNTNDVLRLSFYTSTNLYSEVSYNLLSVDFGNENFMDLLKSQNSRHVNQVVGIVLGSVFLLSSILLILFLILRKI